MCKVDSVCVCVCSQYALHNLTAVVGKLYIVHVVERTGGGGGGACFSVFVTIACILVKCKQAM